MKLAESIGRAIKEHRKAHPGATQRQLAERIGVSESTVHEYESGRCLPSTEALILLAIELGLDLNALARHHVLSMPIRSTATASRRSM